MNDVTRILSAMEHDDPTVSSKLLPLVYDELRKLAAQRMARERCDHTLQPTALVHEAYVRLVGDDGSRHWNTRGHFFAAAAEAMRRILVERARARDATKRGGGRRRMNFDDVAEVVGDDERSEELLALDDALAELERHDPRASALVKLRYFAGLTHQQAAETLGMTRGVADGQWALAKAWLFQRISTS